MEDSDEAVIERLARGDQAALDVLYARYARAVFALACQILGDAADAEDATQEVFVRVWRLARTFDRSRGQVKPWLVCLTRHLVIDSLRRRRCRPRTIQGAAALGRLDTLADPAVDVAARVVEAVDGASLRQALRTLPEPQRRPIELAYFAGLSQAEVAAVVGAPLGTVKGRMRRGMARLRRALDEPRPAGKVP